MHYRGIDLCTEEWRITKGNVREKVCPEIQANFLNLVDRLNRNISGLRKESVLTEQEELSLP